MFPMCFVSNELKEILSMPNPVFTETPTFTRGQNWDICNSWGDWALELIQHYLRGIDAYHQDTRKFIDELKVSGDWA